METPEERSARLVQKRRMDKRNEYLKSIGKPALSQDIDEVRHHLRQMYFAGGMSTDMMAAQSGVTRDTIMAMIMGTRRRKPTEGRRHEVSQMRQSTIDKLLAIEYVPPPGDKNRGGARLPADGKRRRLQALHCAGYTGRFLADQLDMGEYGLRNINMFVHGIKGKTYAYASSVFRVAKLYDKLVDADPVDYGVSPSRAQAARTFAKKNGFAPSWCWDDETIDDPDAVAEWTGFCGALEGYITHRLQDIPMCQPCLDAKPKLHSVKVTPGSLLSRYYRFRPEAMAEVMKLHSVSGNAVEERCGFTKGMVHRWLSGEHGMRIASALKFAEEFDLLWTDLYERIED